MLLCAMHIIMPCVGRVHLYLKKTFKEKKEKHGFQSTGKAREGSVRQGSTGPVCPWLLCGHSLVHALPSVLEG